MPSRNDLISEGFNRACGDIRETATDYAVRVRVEYFLTTLYISTKSGTLFTESRGVEGSGLVKVSFTLRSRGGEGG